MNKRGFVSISLAIAVILLTGAGVILYRQRNSADILELAGKTENSQKVISPNELPLAEQREQETVNQTTEPEQKTAKEKVNQVPQEQKKENKQTLATEKKEPYIKVISPNGWEDWKAGETKEIIWTSDGVNEGVQIDLYRKGVDGYTQVDYAPDTGSYKWMIDRTLESDEYKIVVRGIIKENNKQVKDESDSYFKIVGNQWDTYSSLEYGVKFKYPEKARVNEIGDVDQGYTLITFPDSHQHVVKLAAITSNQNMVAVAALKGGIQKKTEETVYIGNTTLEKESGIGNTDAYDIYYEIYSTTKDGKYFAMVFAVLTDDKNFNPYSEFNTFDYMIHSLEFFEKSTEKQDLQSILEKEFILGATDAPVTMIEYSSHLCGHCVRFHQETLPLLIDKYVANGKMKIIQRILSPVEFGIAVLCAQEQDKFWEMNEYLFENVHDIELSEDIEAIAAKIEIDKDDFNECLDSDKYEEEIIQWFESAGELDVSGTPTFFINSQRIDGNQPIDKFEKVIEEELAKAN